MDRARITLVEATQEHIDAIVGVEREAAGSSLVALTHGHAVREALDRGHYVTVAIDEGEVAGWIWYGTDLGRGAEEVGQIFRVAVAARHAGRGVGRTLLEHAQATLAARGIMRVRITVDAGDEGARAFFERLGYSVDAVSMERPL